MAFIDEPVAMYTKEGSPQRICNRIERKVDVELSSLAVD